MVSRRYEKILDESGVLPEMNAGECIIMNIKRTSSRRHENAAYTYAYTEEHIHLRQGRSERYSKQLFG